MTMHSKILPALLATVVLAWAGDARATPAKLPVQGVLADATGVPLDGAVQIVFQIYAAPTGGPAIFTETHIVNVDRGVFTAYLGSILPLQLAMFDGSDRWVGITVGSDAEMTPRLAFATVPYAARAAECDSVPTGAVMHFELAACPPGWTELIAARGRTIVALPAGGTVSGAVGTGLSNQATRSITQTPAHTHPVDPPATFSDFSGTLSMTGNTSSTGTHGHGVWVEAFGGFGTYGVAGVVNSSGGQYSSEIISGSSGNHNHSVSVAGANHRHSTDIVGFNSGSAGASSVDVTMPYLQLLACRKD